MGGLLNQEMQCQAFSEEKTIQRIGVDALCKGNSLNPCKHPDDFYLNGCDIAKKETLSS